MAGTAIPRVAASHTWPMLTVYTHWSSLEDHLIRLRPLEHRLLRLLARYNQRPVIWWTVHHTLWPDDDLIYDVQHIYSHTSRLRASLAEILPTPIAAPIETLPRIGLRLLWPLDRLTMVDTNPT